MHVSEKHVQVAPFFQKRVDFEGTQAVKLLQSLKKPMAIKEQDLLQPPEGPHRHFQAWKWDTFRQWNHHIFEVFVQYIECVRSCCRQEDHLLIPEVRLCLNGILKKKSTAESATVIWMFFVALTNVFRNYSGSSIAYFGAWSFHMLLSKDHDVFLVLTAVGQASTCCSAAFAQRKATWGNGTQPKDGPLQFCCCQL